MPTRRPYSWKKIRSRVAKKLKGVQLFSSTLAPFLPSSLSHFVSGMRSCQTSNTLLETQRFSAVLDLPLHDCSSPQQKRPNCCQTCRQRVFEKPMQLRSKMPHDLVVECQPRIFWLTANNCLRKQAGKIPTSHIHALMQLAVPSHTPYAIATSLEVPFSTLIGASSKMTAGCHFASCCCLPHLSCLGLHRHVSEGGS